VKLDKGPDIVIYSHVLEHILDPITELTKLKEIMKENSFLYVELPGIKNLNRNYQADFLRLLQNAHIYHFTLASLKNVLRKAGYYFVCGDESIHSIFQKSSLPESADFHYDNGYQNTMAFLHKLEFTRHLHPSKLEAFLSKVLKNIGLYNFTKSFYYRIR